MADLRHGQANTASGSDAEHAPSRDPGPRDVGRGYEHQDVRLKGFICFGVCFVALLAVIHVAVWYLMGSLDRVERADHAGRYGEAVWTTRPSPSEPRLQPSEEHESTDWSDMQTLRAAQLAALESAGFVRDERSGALKVSDAAVQRLGHSLARPGLPATRPADTQAATLPTTGGTP